MERGFNPNYLAFIMSSDSFGGLSGRDEKDA